MSQQAGRRQRRDVTPIVHSYVLTWAVWTSAIVLLILAGCSNPSSPDGANKRHTDHDEPRSASDAPSPSEPSHPGSQDKASPPLILVYVPELAPFAPDLHSAPPELTADEQSAFDHQWRQLRPRVAASCTPRVLAGMSRWQIAETGKVVLAEGWIDSLLLRPQRATPDGARVLLSHPVEEGIELPAHREVVKRRLIVAVEFDRQRATILNTYLNIRGWTEE